MPTLAEILEFFHIRSNSKHKRGHLNQSGRKNPPGKGKKYRKRNILCTGWIRGND